MSLRRFCQLVCYSIKCGGLRYAFVAVGSFGPEYEKYLWECLCVFCEKDDDDYVLVKCPKCDGPRFHQWCATWCVPKKVARMHEWECQWCYPGREYVFSADQVRTARVFIEGIDFQKDPDDPDRKQRAFDLLESHEKLVPPEAVPKACHAEANAEAVPPTNVPVPEPPDSAQTTSDGQGAPLGAKPVALVDDANSDAPKTCAEFRVTPGEIVVYQEQFAHVRGITDENRLQLAMADPTAEGAYLSLHCVDVKDCDAALRDSKQSKFPEVPPEECFYPHELPLRDSNRQSDMYGLENFVILDHPASFRRRTRSQDVRFEAKVRIMDGFLVFFRL